MGRVEKYYNYIVDKLIEDTKVWQANNENFVMALMPTEKHNYNHYKEPEHYGGTGFDCGNLEKAFDEWFNVHDGISEDYESEYLEKQFGLEQGEESDEIMLRYKDRLFIKVKEFCER